MGLIDIALVAFGAKLVVSSIKDEKKRKSTPCKFEESLSEKQFRQIAISEAKKIKRLWLDEIDGSVIYCTVRTVSGLSEWEFNVDYNDYGKITGKYWLNSENNESIIPETYATRVQDRITKSLDNNE